jgi:hypothetical protein
MAMNPNSVGSQIATIVKDAAPAPGTPITDSDLEQMWQDIAGVILGNTGGVRSATVTVTVASVSGVTTGGGVSGPGSGSGVIS